MKPEESLPAIEPEVIERAATDELWRRGILAPWKLHAAQLVLYQLILTAASSRFVLEIARRFGKTWLLVLIAIEVCIRNPGCRVVYGAPTLKHLEEFIHPAFEALIEDAPDDCRPWFNAKKGHWVFPNGSYVHLFGADDKTKANRGRGAGAILCIFDECGFTRVLKYVLRSVLRPQLLHTKRKKGSFQGMTLLASTPAEEPDHDFTVIAERAEAQGNYARRTIFENPLLTDEQRETYLADDAKEEGLTPEQYRETDDYRREWLAERVVNKLLVVMGQDWELSKEKSFNLYRELQRPEFFDGMTTLDPGGYDPHGILFGYWHFPRAVLVVDAELLLRDGENTEQLQAAVKQTEAELWGVNRWEGTLRAYEDEELLKNLPDWVMEKVNQKAPTQPYVRWCDTNIQLARDLHELHGITFLPTAKDNLELQVNNVRVMFRGLQIAVNPDCVHLVRHLTGTVWKNEKRKEFQRRAGEHGDLLAALIYKARNVNRQRNPYPKGAVVPLRPDVAVALRAKEQERRKADEAIASALLGGTSFGRRLMKTRRR